MTTLDRDHRAAVTVTVAVTVADPARRVRRLTAAGWGVAGLAVAVATWAVVASLLVLPYLSINRDETVYLLQADTLRSGRLFPVAPEPAEAFTPWFGVASAGRFVLKYTPVHAAMLALGRIVAGTERATLAVLAAAAVVLLYLLAVEVLKDRRQALLAAGLLAVSPLFLVQSMTFLSYVGNVVLLLGFAVALLRSERTGSRALLVVAGVALGLAFWARAYDAVLFATPFAGWFVLRNWRTPARLATRTTFLAAGVLPLLAAVLWFNQRATGDALMFPFSMFDPLDTLGFGPRRLVPSDPILDYTPAVAVQSSLSYSSLLLRWAPGGALAIALGMVGLRKADPEQRAVAAVVATVLAGYFFFWGPENVLWMTPYLGPFYYLPLFVPLSILGARGLTRLARWSVPLAVVTLVAGVACSGFVTDRVLRKNARETRAAAAVQQPIADAAPRDAVVFLPGSTLMNPFGFARNHPTFDGEIVWAVDRRAANFEVLDRFPDRTPYVLGLPGVYGGTSDAPDEQRLALQRMDRVRSAAVAWTVRPENRTSLPVVSLEVAVATGTGTPTAVTSMSALAPDPSSTTATLVAMTSAEVVVLTRQSGAGAVLDGSLRLDAAGVSFVGASGGQPLRTAKALPAEGVLTLTLTASDPSRTSVRPLGRLSIPYRFVDGRLDALVPSEASSVYSSPRSS